MATASPKKRRPVSAKWRKLLSLVPGYDPIATAGECWFDAAAAQRALDFFPECIRHVEGDLAGQPFELQPWQKAVVANLFGWKRIDSQGREVRRYRECLIYVGRKNGKTPLVAALALYVFFCDGEKGAQCYIAAGEREQAGMLFRQAKGMVEQEPELNSRCRIYGGNASAGQSKSIVKEDDGSFLRVISADAETKHGGTTHLAMIDELHVQPNRELVDVLRTSMSSTNRKQPLLIYLTTADFARPSICNEIHERACKVRDRIIDDEAFLPVVYEADIDDDWTDPATWVKANPNLHVSKSLDYLERECKLALENPQQENTFKRLDLNIKTEQAMRVIPMHKWDACARKPDYEALRGRPCFGGLDIGATSDFTAFVLLFPQDDGQRVEVPVNMEEPDGPTKTIVRKSYTLLSWFWLCSEPPRRDPRMMDQIDAWRKQGFIRTTWGDVVDYDVVLRDIVDICEPYSLQQLGVDRGFQGGQMCTNLMRELGDEKVNAVSQGIISMAQPFREVCELVLQERLHHDGNPVLRWMASNTAAEQRGGLIKPSKDHSTEKIDGITATTTAMSLAIVDIEASIYARENRGFIELG